MAVKQQVLLWKCSLAAGRVCCRAEQRWAATEQLCSHRGGGLCWVSPQHRGHVNQCKMSPDGNAPPGCAGGTGFVTELCHPSPPPAKSVQCCDAGEGCAVSCGRKGAMPPALLRAQGEPGGRGRLCRERKAEIGAGMAGKGSGEGNSL